MCIIFALRIMPGIVDTKILLVTSLVTKLVLHQCSASVSPEEVKRGLERSTYIPHANTVHMSHQGLSGTSVGAHT